MDRRTPDRDPGVGAARTGRGPARILSFLSGLMLGAVLVVAGLAGLSLWSRSQDAVRVTPGQVAEMPGAPAPVAAQAPAQVAEPFVEGGGAQPPGVGVTLPFNAGPTGAAGESDPPGGAKMPASPAAGPPAAGSTTPDARSDAQGGAAQPGGADAEPGDHISAEPASRTTAPGESGTAAYSTQEAGAPSDGQAPAQDGTTTQAAGQDSQAGQPAAGPDRAAAAAAEGEAALQPELTAEAASDAGAPAAPEGQASAQGGVAAAQPDSRTMTEPDGAPAAVEPQRAGAPGSEGATAPETATGAAPAAAETSGAPELALAGPALSVNARAFEAPPDEPLLSIVLVDQGHYDLTAETLSMLTMPLTVAIRPDAAGAASLGAAARAAGHEVLADLSLLAAPDALPAEAARDMAVLDMAVGVTATGSAADAGALAPLLGALKEDGFAWVAAGAEAAAGDAAREAGVPFAASATPIAGGATADRVYDQIDSAARGALQDGSAVLFLGVSEPALQGLIRWGLEHPRPVTFAPVSAVIGERKAG